VTCYNGTGNGEDKAAALALDSMDNVYVTGYSDGGGTSHDYATIKYGPNGDQLWVTCYNGTGNGDDKAAALALDDAVNVYVTGWSYGVGTDYDYTTIKYIQEEEEDHWIDSWTADANGQYWYTPECYTFKKGQDIACCTSIHLATETERLLRWDAFYFCGETNPKNYIAHGFSDFGPVPAGDWILGLFYMTDYIPDKLLPLNLDWASKFYRMGPSYRFYGGIPLSNRPDCFVVNR
jgi:hypothetical protein